MPYLGIDVGSVATKVILLSDHQQIEASVAKPTLGEPEKAAVSALERIRKDRPDLNGLPIAVTGSAREFIGQRTGAVLVKNEITAQAAAAAHYFPRVRTIIEIGGQDSKLILLRDGLVADFGLNTVCAAGTGSFLDHQAQRLGLSLSDFGRLAMRSQSPIEISGRCTVFAESEMIHHQQSGVLPEDIVYGMCRALVRNYLGSVAAGKELEPPVAFQGGVAYNPGMVRAFEEELKTRLVIPPQPEMMGAIGVALLVQKETLSHHPSVNERAESLGL